jgi:hypothetical protein
MFSTTHNVSVKGRIHAVPAEKIGDVVIVIRGRFPRVAEVFDEYWVPVATLPEPHDVLARLKGDGRAPDLFTFAQRVPDTEPRYSFPMEWDNVAVIPVSSYEHWFKEQISSATRRNIRAAERKGVVVKSVPFDDDYVRGIMGIYNESPVRAGRRFWHYGKDFASVEAENGTYRDRATFLAAFVGEEMVGYTKIVWDTRSAAIMQILSKLQFRDIRPNNAMLSAAVKLCAERSVPYLLYEKYVYDGKVDSSLTRFKKENGFVRMDLPRYNVPLTLRGKILLRLGLHREAKGLIPLSLRTRFVSFREKWYARRARQM